MVFLIIFKKLGIICKKLYNLEIFSDYAAIEETVRSENRDGRKIGSVWPVKWCDRGIYRFVGILAFFLKRNLGFDIDTFDRVSYINFEKLEEKSQISNLRPINIFEHNGKV